ncbi:sulfite exporter TauE/SafE family protein [Marinobacterium stanieri]|uniref:sulfite exporter TauE/SafE family protein n=1 Tax=Marinobacterium stanieri TaxID=49186 RepID=UPI0002558C01|nr:sulfite exporter TauE/SafE family protein [Marinobacterium stanieri]
MPELLSLIPADLLPLDALLLVAMAGLTSLMTATLGIGGGVLLLVIMAQLMPIAALIPVHGLVQLGSNANRALMTRQHIDWPLSRRFLIGAACGAALASLVVVQLPLELIQLAVGGFILWMIWGPKPAAKTLSPLKTLMAGGLTTFFSMFVGATGPLVAAFVHRHSHDKMQTVATFATTMTGQHLLKGVVFSVVGFSFTDWLPLIVAMVLSGMLGTWIGLNLLQRVSSVWFNRLFRVVVTLLALRLLWQAGETLLPRLLG